MRGLTPYLTGVAGRLARGALRRARTAVVADRQTHRALNRALGTRCAGGGPGGRVQDAAGDARAAR